MGRGTIETGLLRAEQHDWQIRTTDPAVTHEGEAWVRSDLAPETNQIATLRFDRGASTVDIPIFDSAASVTNIEKVWRVRVGGVTGFIPLAASGVTGAYDFLKFQHGGTALDTHDALEVSAIPDSAIAHYDATQLSLSDGQTVSTWSDKTGNGNDLTENGGPTYVASGINGMPVVHFDGVDDLMTATFAQSANPSRIYAVLALQETSPTDDQHVFNRVDSPTTQSALLAGGDSGLLNGNWGMYAGSVGSFGQPPTTSNTVLTWDINGSSSTLRLNQSELTTDLDPGTGTLNGISVGGRGDDSYHTNVYVGEITVDPEPTDGPGSYEQSLADKWGITF